MRRFSIFNSGFSTSGPAAPYFPAMINSKIINRKSKMPAAHWARIRLFAMDVDGVLTDGTILVSSDGTESKAFSILDGHGLRELARAGIITAWISGRSSGATTARAQELQIPHLIQGRTDKLAALQELSAQLGLESAECAYMGDDNFDALALSWAGVGIAPPAAMPAVLASADYVTTRPAGLGAVREVCDLLLLARVFSAIAPAGTPPRKTRNPAPPVRSKRA